MNTLKKQFSDALKREGKIITTYYTSESVKCLFRINKDYNKTDNHITIFYDIDSPIKQGRLLTYGGKNYLTLNQESVENDTYYKSSLLECNLTIPVTIGGVVKQIPCYSYDLNSAYATSNNVLTVVDGNGEIITELIPELSATAYIDKGFRIMGGYYKVANMYNLVGISHLMIERASMPADVNTLEITTELSEYKVGETAIITANTTTNGIVQTDQIITYTSSDETLATVDSAGVITFLEVGTVIITGKWTEKNVADTLSLVILEADVPVSNYTMTITASADLELGYTRTFTPTLKDSTNTVVSTWTAIWSFNYNGMDTSMFTITYVGNQCKILVNEDYYDGLGISMILTCTTSDGVASASYDAMVSAGW